MNYLHFGQTDTNALGALVSASATGIYTKAKSIGNLNQKLYKIVADTQNFTVAISLGYQRQVAFEHALNGNTLSFGAPNGSAYVFTKDVNIEYKHGILQEKEPGGPEKGRISIIAWGWHEMTDA